MIWVFLTINRFDNNFVNLCDTESDPEEDVKVWEDTSLKVVHDAVIQLWPQITILLYSNFHKS